MKNIIICVSLFSAFCLCGNINAKHQLNTVNQPTMRLWYDKPAEDWMMQALPIGNGEFGGMFFGGVEREQLQFNDKTLWTGNSEKRGAYQNFGDLFIDFQCIGDKATNYKRELSLDNAIGSVSYTLGGIKYLREYFCSFPDKSIVMRLSTQGKKGKLSFSVDLQDAHEGKKSVSGNKITISGKLDILNYEAQVAVLNSGGKLSTKENKITVENADEVTILLTGATNYDIHSPTYFSGSADDIHNRISEITNAASKKSFAELKSCHLADYQPIFDRVKLDFGAKAPEIPTDELVKNHRESAYLDMLYFQYGRYLLIASSRGTDLPNNLQGLWNNSNRPPWESDIHSNINIQMNYWLAENANLSECHLPFTNYITAEAMKQSGSWTEMAKWHGCRGWTIKTQNNIFGYSDWNWNRPANAWYCMHLWQHFEYTQDVDYLEKSFPAMKAACEFWFDRMIIDDHGKWVAPDEWSPEQSSWSAGLENGIAYAQQLIRELFDNTLKATAFVKTDEKFISELKSKFEKLDNGLHVGSWGQIREWRKKDDIQGDEHRHLSHLIALYPGNQISYLKDSVYANAAKTALLSRGDGGTGWSRAWKIACWARLLDGEHAYKLLKNALEVDYHDKIVMSNAGGVYENLFDSHPPFQIDGNFGATAGITEMLIQSNLGFIHFLPALPEAWKTGSFSGLKTTANFSVDLKWKNAKPTEATILSNAGNECKIYTPDNRIKITDENGKTIETADNPGNIISFRTEKGKIYKIIFMTTTAKP